MITASMCNDQMHVFSNLLTFNSSFGILYLNYLIFMYTNSAWPQYLQYMYVYFQGAGPYLWTRELLFSLWFGESQILFLFSFRFNSIFLMSNNCFEHNIENPFLFIQYTFKYYKRKFRLPSDVWHNKIDHSIFPFCLIIEDFFPSSECFQESGSLFL